MTSVVRFAELYDALTAIGLEVGVARCDGGLAIAVSDPDGDRSIRLAVDRDFDRTAQALVCSVCLREWFGSRGAMPDLVARDRECRGRWPEFLELWPVRRERAA